MSGLFFLNRRCLPDTITKKQEEVAMARKLENEQIGRVLRRYDRTHTLPMRFASYDVNIVAVPYEMNGISACTLFFPKGKDHAANRACKLGWHDETAKWRVKVGIDSDKEPMADFTNLGWHDLRKLASSKGIDLSGKRPDIERRLKEHFAGAFSEAVA
jgi:hypothetical protein